MRFMVDSNVNGLMFQLGNIMRIDNGFVEESVCFNTAGGYIVVSYNDTSMGRNNRQQVRLNINRNTQLLPNKIFILYIKNVPLLPKKTVKWYIFSN